MKKLLALSLTLLMLLCTLCACNSGDSATPDEAQDDAASPVQIYLDNADVWEVKDANIWFGYFFIDLDFDGTLELIQTTRESNSDKTTNKFFKLDTEAKTVTEIPCTDEDAINRWDFTGGDYPQIYKDNATGDLKYMVYDNSKEDVTTGSTRIGEMTYDAENGIKTRCLWGFSYSLDGSSTDGNMDFVYTAFDKNNISREISSGEYNNILSEYELDNTNLTLSFKYIGQTTDTYTYSELTAEEKLNVFTEAYNAFTYNK